MFRALVVAGKSGLAAGTLAEQLGVSAPVLSFHLKELRVNSLIDSEQLGRFVIYRARFDTMNALLGFMTENWCATCQSTEGADCCPSVQTAEGTTLRNDFTYTSPSKI